MQKKIKGIEKVGQKVGLRKNKTKTKVMRIKTRRKEKIEINGKELEDVNEYSYLGSIVMGHGRADEDVTSCITYLLAELSPF
jgi:hypothetical protein